MHTLRAKVTYHQTSYHTINNGGMRTFIVMFCYFPLPKTS